MNQRDELIKETEKLIDECQRLRRELAIAYRWDAPKVEVAPIGWHEEADEKHLWKMFRGSHV